MPALARAPSLWLPAAVLRRMGSHWSGRKPPKPLHKLTERVSRALPA